MLRKSRIYILLLCLVMSLSVRANELSETARISLITCSPGEALYEKYGHTALRVYDPVNDIDITFNYGIFDFDVDHFYWKFVKGETWYQLGAMMTYWFMLDYAEDGRNVSEQILNLTPEQTESLWMALKTNYQPQNRYYLYNFVFDNCATRPYRLIANTLNDTIISDYTGYTGQTYRRFIRHYTDGLSWANAGINLLFGPKADQPMDSEQRLFLPEELMLFMQSAHLSDGSPLVCQSAITPFSVAKTPWWASWPLGLACYFILMALISWYDRKRQRWSWWVDLIVAVPYGLLLVIVTFLTFFSCHPLVGFGWRLLIIPLTHICARLICIVR